MNLDDGWTGWLLGAAYAAFLLEWGIYAVASEASARQLLRRVPAAADPLAVVLGRPWLGRLVRFGLPTALGVAVGIAPAIAWITPLPGTIAAPAWLAWAGLAIALGSRLWSLWAALELRAAQRRGELARSGPFRWSRHPILLGIHVFLLGIGLVQPNVAQLGGLALWILLMHARVQLEEHVLLQRYGAAYRDYRASVACYLHGGWRQRAR